MAGVKSNFPEVERSLNRLAGSLSMIRRPKGQRKRLADTAFDIVAEGIYETAALDQTDPDGNPLAPLKPRTIARKRAKGYPDTIGVETGLMLSLKEIRGTTDVEPQQATMFYGRTRKAEELATYFQEGRQGVQRKRPFYAISRRTEKLLDKFFDDALDSGVEECAD